MGVPEDYTKMAAECLQLARTVRDTESKAILLEIAQSWVKLAAKATAKEKDA